MDYKVENNENTTITNGVFKKWNEKNLFDFEYPVERLIETLSVVQAFKRKYPKDESVLGFDEILRDEICHLFGGELVDDE